MAAKRKKLEATVEAVRQAVGQTWFDITDDGAHIELGSRDNGDVGEERPGQVDIAEGRRLMGLLRAVFKPASWEIKGDTVDEWVSITLRKHPYTGEELAAQRHKASMRRLEEEMKLACDEANSALPQAKDPAFGRPFRAHVYAGIHDHNVTIAATFGKRILYHRPGTDFVFAAADEADAVLKGIVARFSAYAWTRSVSGPYEQRTGNRRPPDNLIESKGEVEYGTRIRPPTPKKRAK